MTMLARYLSFLVIIGFSFPLLLGCSTAPAQSQPTAAKPAAQPTAAKPVAGQPTAAAQPAAKAAAPTGAFRFGAAALTSEAMDPMLGAGGAKQYLELMFDTLVSLGPEGDFDPKVSLAEKWDVAPDSTSYTFYIRKGVKFHNGDDLTAEDVKFSIERITSEKSKAPYIAGMRKNIGKIELIDSHTVRFQLNAPYVFLLSDLSNGNGNEGMVMPKKYIEAVGDAGFVAKPVGSGPYKYVDYRKGDYLKLEAVDKHWKVGVPKYKEITWRIIPEEATRVALLQRGDVEMIDVPARASKELEKAGFNRYVKPGGEAIVFYPNNQWEPPFSEVKVRQAVNIAIDRQAINDSILEGIGDPSSNFPMSTADIAYKTKSPPYPYDPTKAKELLKEAGRPNVKLNLYSYPRPGFAEAQRTVEAVASMWKAVGADAQITASEYGVYRDKWAKKAFTPGDVGLTTALQTNISGPISSLFGLDRVLPIVVDPKALELRDAVLASKTIDEYKERASVMQKYVVDSYLFIPIGDLRQVYVTQPSIKNLRLPAKEFNNWGLVSIITQ